MIQTKAPPIVGVPLLFLWSSWYTGATFPSTEDSFILTPILYLYKNFVKSGVQAIAGGSGPFTKVRLSDGTEGFIETDQIVAAPEASTREAQLESARFV